MYPELKGWFIEDWTRTSLLISLDLENPMYISTGDISDEVIVKVKQNLAFRAIDNDDPIRKDYTFISTIPSQSKNSDDALFMMNIGSGTKNSMMLTLVVPFVFMMFMAVSLNRVWSLYLMM